MRRWEHLLSIFLFILSWMLMGFLSGAEAEYLCQAQTGEYSHLKVLFLICTNAISKQIVSWIVFVETFLLLWIQCFPPRCCERFQWQCLDQRCNNESRPVWQLQGQWPTAWVLQNLRFHSFEVEWNARNWIRSHIAQVYVPYCTSDAYSGRKGASSETGGYAFYGKV